MSRITGYNLYKFSRSTYIALKRRITHWKNLLTDPQPKLLIIVYHRVSREIKRNPLNTVLPLEVFMKQLNGLATKYPVISLSDAALQCKERMPKAATQLLLTFDDGYQDNYEIVYPILKQKGWPAAFFIIPGYIGENKPLWDWEFSAILNSNATVQSIKMADTLIHQGKKEPRLSFIFRVLERMKSADVNLREKVLASLREQSKKNIAHEDICMSWEQLGRMRNDGMEIGAHSISHRSLARIPLAEAIYEIRKSKKVIEDNLKEECAHFAFPFGSKSDYTQELIDEVKKTGFHTCLLNIHGYNHIMADTFCFKRIIMDASTDLRYLFG